MSLDNDSQLLKLTTLVECNLYNLHIACSPSFTLHVPRICIEFSTSDKIAIGVTHWSHNRSRARLRKTAVCHKLSKIHQLSLTRSKANIAYRNAIFQGIICSIIFLSHHSVSGEVVYRAKLQTDPLCCFRPSRSAQISKDWGCFLKGWMVHTFLDIRERERGDNPTLKVFLLSDATT